MGAAGEDDLAGLMGFLLTLSLIIALAGVTVRSMTREKAARDRAEAIKVRVRQAHGLQAVFVSRDDGSLVGLSTAGDVLVVGQGDADEAVPTTAIVTIEGLRDGVVLISADRTTDPSPPAPTRDRTSLPEKIRSLALRLTLADGATYVVTFFDRGRHGAPPGNEAFRKAAARTEDWFRRITHAMRLAS